jgi:hypothetical protein
MLKVIVNDATKIKPFFDGKDKTVNWYGTNYRRYISIYIIILNILIWLRWHQIWAFGGLYHQ